MSWNVAVEDAQNWGLTGAIVGIELLNAGGERVQLLSQSLRLTRGAIKINFLPIKCCWRDLGLIRGGINVLSWGIGGIFLGARG